MVSIAHDDSNIHAHPHKYMHCIMLIVEIIFPRTN